MRGCVVEIEEVLLDVLAVVSFTIRQPEQPLLQDRILLVPERHGEAEVLVAIAKPRETVLVPAIGAASRVVVRKVLPSASVGAVVFPHRSPRAIAHVRAPALPIGSSGRRCR